MTNKRAAEVLSMAVTFNGCGRCTGDEMREAVKMACATLEATEWISVSDRLPEEGVGVLAWDGEDVFLAYYSKRRERWIDLTGYCKATHWMPLPEPPKEDA